MVKQIFLLIQLRNADNIDQCNNAKHLYHESILINI